MLTIFTCWGLGARVWARLGVLLRNCHASRIVGRRRGDTLGSAAGSVAASIACFRAHHRWVREADALPAGIRQDEHSLLQ